jgi:muramoyltetrapeptide carboxypeptidase
MKFEASAINGGFFIYFQFMIVAPFLKKNDTVAIVAPGRKIKKEELEAAQKIIHGWGVETIIAKNIFSEQHSYLSGTDNERLEDFQMMIDDDSVKAIICARGGYGSTRILDELHFSALEKNPKWIVGFSDITAIHLKLFSLGIQSIHGTMPVLFSKEASKDSVSSLRKLLFGEIDVIEAKPCIENRLGQCSGQTIGGNLSLLVDSLATTSEPDTSGKILILEEIDEYSYRLDRMMMQLKRAGKLKNLSGLIIGHFTDVKDTELTFGETFQEIIMHVIKGYDYPVAFGFPIGHENPNLAWQHGAPATLTVNVSGSVLKY